MQVIRLQDSLTPVPDVAFSASAEAVGRGVVAEVADLEWGEAGGEAPILMYLPMDMGTMHLSPAIQDTLPTIHHHMGTEAINA